jgi:hypothetical protein
MKVAIRIGLALALTPVFAVSAQAHAKLVGSMPAADSVVAGPVGQMDLVFSEEIAGKLSGAVVSAMIRSLPGKWTSPPNTHSGPAHTRSIGARWPPMTDIAPRERSASP